jgi:hypothetical protein
VAGGLADWSGAAVAREGAIKLPANRGEARRESSSGVRAVAVTPPEPVRGSEAPARVDGEPDAGAWSRSAAEASVAALVAALGVGLIKDRLVVVVSGEEVGEVVVVVVVLSWVVTGAAPMIVPLMK